MIVPKVDPQDVTDIKTIISNIFIQQPNKVGGGIRPQIAFDPEECDVLVGTVLSELGRRGYAVMKPEPE